MTRIRLPIDCDISATSLEWACSLLKETPTVLLVHHEDVSYAERAVAGVADCDVPIIVDSRLSRDAWILEGETYEVYSDGA